MKLISNLITYLKEAKIELSKVVWPNKKQTTNYTLVVIALSLGVAAFFAILDYIFDLGLGLIIK